MTENPILSILIPAYEYPEGLERVLKALSPASAEIEILVFDDSCTQELKRIVNKYSLHIPNLFYRHNLSIYGATLGAGENWNALLSAARGRYIILMHHDEFPCGSNFFSRLLPILSENKSVDIVMLDLLLLDESLRPLPSHVPKRFRWLVTQLVPSYLFRRNVIGPTASLVIRRSIVPRFDLSLRWLIDVDFYIKLCRSGLHWKNAPLIQIGSVQRMVGTITNQLAPELSAIDASERRYLAEKYPNNSVWLGSSLNIPLCFLELIVWISLRFYLIVMHKFYNLFVGK